MNRNRSGWWAGSIAALVSLVGCAELGEGVRTDSVVPTSGVEAQYTDGAVRAQDDFYRHVNGKWLTTTEIPADRPAWGAYYQLDDASLLQVRALIDEAGKGGSQAAPLSADKKKIADFYASFMNDAKLDSLGVRPIARELAGITALKDKREIPALIAYFNQTGVTAPYGVTIQQDARNATRYLPIVFQSGLGLPDRDYYLKGDDARLKDTLAKYQVHVAKILALAGEKNTDEAARQVVALETELARVQWTRVENRDPVKTYNKVQITRLAALAPGYDWRSWLSVADLAGKADALIIAQPSYLTGFSNALKSAPLAAWKAYFKYHLIAAYAPYLSAPLVDESFAFAGTVLRGTPSNLPKWKRGVGVVERGMGDALGRLYVARYFLPESKARMEALVGNILVAYRESIDGLDWMSAPTKKEAQAKLATFTPKIGYPDKWRDYSALTIKADDLVGNVTRANAFEYQRNVAKLGKPVDKSEWFMTPQTVNAYYNPRRNEIVFPAAILQPPLFDPKADDAVNYGAIGAVIGHEISHGFDDSGSQYDGDGNLRDWWTKEDREKFSARTRALVEQYNAFSPLPGYTVNGALTLGENIADNSGLSIAYKAWKGSLGGKPSPVIDRLPGDARFYTGFAQIWRQKTREGERLVRLKSDPHSPGEFRANGTVRNQTPFYNAFNIKPGDAMYLAPDKRVSIW